MQSTDGVQLAVHELGGDTTMRPLLLCHATGFHARVWDAVAAEFPDRRCVALDFRGYGDSTPPADGRFDWKGFADDVLAVIDELGVSEVQAVGHSKGGAALLVAELARPGTFERLVCFEPIVFPAPTEGVPTPSTGPNPMAEAARRRRAHFDSIEAAVERFSSKATLGRLRPDVLEAYVRHGLRPDPDGGVVLKADPEHEARTYEMGPELGAFERIRGVGSPVLVCAGDDGDLPGQLAPMVAEQLPRGSFHRFEGLGHFGPLEDPARFAAVVRAFLEDPDPDDHG
ncbi:MAG: alpha/beta hydrolase [Acidimicrobiales bacterium]|nr:alpha/beta hydrolase [Acidimicrobiales bacterium]